VSLLDFYYTNSRKAGATLALKRFLGFLFDSLILPFDHVIARRRDSGYSSFGTIVPSESGKIAIIATHVLTPTGVNNFAFALAELLAGGFHVFIVDSGHLQFSTQNQNVTIIKRNNLGRDFGSFRDALNILDLYKTDELILMNDSCFWSEGSMRKYLTEMTGEFSDVQCITLSYQKVPHPQSYFLHILAPSIAVIQDFFKNEVRNWRSKRNVVRRGEIALGRYLIESRCGVVDLFGGHNLVLHKQKKMLQDLKSTNTILSHPQEVFRLIGIVKVRQKDLIDPNLQSKANIPPEYARLFYVI
jgi:hypothetical protein